METWTGPLLSEASPSLERILLFVPPKSKYKYKIVARGVWESLMEAMHVL